MPRSTNKASKAKRTGKCHMCGDTGHYARDCKERKTDSEEVVLHDTMKCHVCGETGHYARECKDKKSDTVKVALKAIIGSGTRSNKKAQGWYLNCGSSEHVCYSRDMFVDYNPMKDHEVILDNKDHLDVAGIGTVVIRFDTDKVLTLSNVLHIPKISKCYVSVAKLDDLGYIISFVSGTGVGVITKSHKGKSH
ncbi:ribosomal protein [Tanacetum coccineum]